MREAIIISIALLLLLVACAIAERVGQYKKQSKYIKMEISRSCDRNERIHWEHELKRLRKRCFPLIYLFKK